MFRSFYANFTHGERLFNRPIWHANFTRGGHVADDAALLRLKINRLAGISYERALFYDKDGKRQQSALIAYMDYLNKFPDSDKADSVRKRIDELQAQVDKQDSTNKVPEPDTERPVSKASGSEEK